MAAEHLFKQGRARSGQADDEDGLIGPKQRCWPASQEIRISEAFYLSDFVGQRPGIIADGFCADPVALAVVMEGAGVIDAVMEGPPICEVEQCNVTFVIAILSACRITKISSSVSILHLMLAKAIFDQHKGGRQKLEVVRQLPGHVRSERDGAPRSEILGHTNRKVDTLGLLSRRS